MFAHGLSPVRLASNCCLWNSSQSGAPAGSWILLDKKMDKKINKFINFHSFISLQYFHSFKISFHLISSIFKKILFILFLKIFTFFFNFLKQTPNYVWFLIFYRFFFNFFKNKTSFASRPATNGGDMVAWLDHLLLPIHCCPSAGSFVGNFDDLKLRIEE